MMVKNSSLSLSLIGVLFSRTAADVKCKPTLLCKGLEGERWKINQIRDHPNLCPDGVLYDKQSLLNIKNNKNNHAKIIFGLGDINGHNGFSSHLDLIPQIQIDHIKEYSFLVHKNYRELNFKFYDVTQRQRRPPRVYGLHDVTYKCSCREKSHRQCHVSALRRALQVNKVTQVVWKLQDGDASTNVSTGTSTSTGTGNGTGNDSVKSVNSTSDMPLEDEPVLPPPPRRRSSKSGRCGDFRKSRDSKRDSKSSHEGRRKSSRSSRRYSKHSKKQSSKEISRRYSIRESSKNKSRRNSNKKSSRDSSSRRHSAKTSSRNSSRRHSTQKNRSSRRHSSSQHSTRGSSRTSGRHSKRESSQQDSKSRSSLGSYTRSAHDSGSSQVRQSRTRIRRPSTARNPLKDVRQKVPLELNLSMPDEEYPDIQPERHVHVTFANANEAILNHDNRNHSPSERKTKPEEAEVVEF